MTKDEILSELPRLRREDLRDIARRVFQLAEQSYELDWAAQAADQAFQVIDSLEAVASSLNP